MTTLRNIALLISRVLLGIILIAHGWQKLNDITIAGVTEFFQSLGIPNAQAAATFTTYFELVAGAMLILGLLVRFVGPVLFVFMVGAFWFAHRDNGIFIDNGGWEYVAVFGAAGLAIASAGAGRLSIDQLIAGPIRNRREQKRLEEATDKGMAVQHSDGSVTYPAQQAPINTNAAATQAQPQVQTTPVESEQVVTNNGEHTIVAEQEPTTQFPSENR